MESLPSDAELKLTSDQIDGAEDLGIMAHRFRIFKLKSDDLIIFLLKDNDKIIGQAAFQHVNISNISGYLGKNIFIKSEYQNKGYGADFYSFIWKYLKAPIFSDEAQTKAGQALWSSLSKRYDIKVLNTLTGEISSRKNYLDNQIYTLDPKKSGDYLLMIEGKKVSIIPELSKEAREIIVPYALFENGDY